mgnify:CR=1 FL=1
MIKVVSAKELNLNERRHLHEILRIAYALTEVEVWGENYVRITFDDYNALIEKGEILAALYEGNVVGGIHYYKRREGVYSFSLLCADFDKSGLGIGRALVDKVEEEAKQDGAVEIELEILRPAGMEVPFKIRISDWYKRMGFVYTHSQDFSEILPEKAKNLANPSNFDYYLKKLI